MLKNIPFYASLLEKEEKPTIGMVLVYGAIEAHSFGEKGCIASNETIAKECGLKEKTVANAISTLNKLGWVKVHLDGNNHRLLIEPSLTIEPPSLAGEPPFTVQGTPLPATRNIEYSNKNTVIENTNSELLLLVKEKLNRKFRVLPRGAKTLLKQFTMEEIATALTNMTKDPWHKERIGELKIDYILRPTTIDNMLTRKVAQTSQVSKYKTVDQLHPEVVLTDEERKRKLDSLAELKKKLLKR